MKYRMNGIGRSPLLTASILILGLLLAGCDDPRHRDSRCEYPHTQGEHLGLEACRATQGRGPASCCIAGRDLARRKPSRANPAPTTKSFASASARQSSRHCRPRDCGKSATRKLLISSWTITSLYGGTT